MGLMDFYLCSNAIREFVLTLCQLSNQVFEISLNSSLVTDELASHGAHLKSYAVYSEKMNSISNSLGLSAREMLRMSTRIMELSLEKTKYNARSVKLREGRRLIDKEANIRVLSAAIDGLTKNAQSLDTEVADILGTLDHDLKSYQHEIKKLWLLSTGLKAQVEFDEVGQLSNINTKIDTVLARTEKTMGTLLIQLTKIGTTV